MAYGEFYVERQYWARFPKVLIMCRKHGRMENGNCAVERRRYVPEQTCEVVDFIEHKLMDEPDIVELSCGHDVMVFDEGEYLNYCPECGARVVGE